MRFYILRNQVVVLASSAKEFGEWVERADRVVSHTKVGLTGSPITTVGDDGGGEMGMTDNGKMRE